MFEKCAFYFTFPGNVPRAINFIITDDYRIQYIHILEKGLLIEGLLIKQNCHHSTQIMSTLFQLFRQNCNIVTYSSFEIFQIRWNITTHDGEFAALLAAELQ